MPAMFAQILPTSFPRHIYYTIYICSPCVRTRISNGEKKIFTIKKQKSACKQRRTPVKRKMHTCAEYVYHVSTFILYTLYTMNNNNNNSNKYNNKRKSRFLRSRQKNCVILGPIFRLNRFE